jgi:serine/threonine protein kinase/WD40 repeat protein/tetratricopeptide (TPR) repeat protein
MSEQTSAGAPPTAAPSLTDRLGAILESFLNRYRLGERPSVDEFVSQFPELRDDVRELLSAVVEMEHIGSNTETTADAFRPTSPQASESTPALGQRLDGSPKRMGDYRILRKIGAGGMGVVFEAVRESLRSHVALKVMHARFRNDQTYVRRFHTEASSAARLHHSNIVSVFDYGKHDGVCYYAMQYIAGHGLDRILDDVRRLRDGGQNGTRAHDDKAVGWHENSDSAVHHGPAAKLGVEPAIESSLRPLTLAILSGRYAGDSGKGSTLADGVATPTATAEIQAPRGHGSECDRSAEIDSGLGSEEFAQSGAPGAQSASGPANNLPSGSGSLSDKSENHYFREVARLVTQAADALAYSHGRGVLHRDIKPSNLLIDATGTLWVTDFGLAKFEGGEDLSQSQDLVGTLRYMAPERFRCVSDRRSDIYALGATLYEMLTLHPVFEANDQLELIDRIKNEPPVPPRHHDRRIPRDLETIVLKSLAKDPTDRFATADEMAEELQRFHQYRPIHSRPVPWNERLWRWGRRNPMIAALNLVAACLALTIIVILSWSTRRNGRLVFELRSKNVIASRNLSQANRNLVVAYASQAEAFTRSRRPGQRFEALGAIERAMNLSPAAELSESDRLGLRNSAISALALPDIRVAQEIDVAHAKEHGLAFDRAFARYATKLDDGTVVVRQVADGQDLIRLRGQPPPQGYTTAQFSPDGRFLAITTIANNGLEVWDLKERRLAFVDQLLWSGPLRTWSFRPDGAELALVHRNQSVAIYALPSGKPIDPPPEKLRAWGAVTYSPDGAKLAAQAEDKWTVNIFARATGRLLTSLRHQSLTIQLAWHPRRPNVLAVSCEDGTICLWNTDSRENHPLRLLTGEQGGGGVLAFHPSGELLASRGYSNVLRLWDTRAGQLLLSQPSAWHSTLEFDESGTRLGVDALATRARILEVASPAECRVLASDASSAKPFGPIAIDAAGRRLVASSDQITVFDLPSGTPRASINVNYWSKSILFDHKGAILTQAPVLLRWPIYEAEDGSGVIGPPELLHRRSLWDGIGISADGGTVAQAVYDDGAFVFSVEHPLRRRWLRRQRDVRYVAVSPNGQWVVTSSHDNFNGMRLWEAATGRPVHDFPNVPKTVDRPVFSPDGEWLAVAWDGWALLDTKTWKPAMRVGDSPANLFAFAPDSRTAVYDNNGGVLTLFDLSTSKELARLEDPAQARHAGLAFTPDGSQLVTSLRDRPFLRIWNLSLIRQRLLELGLDWTAPPRIKPSMPVDTPPYDPLPYQVELGNLDHWAKQALDGSVKEKWPSGEAALALYGDALRENPKDAEARFLRGQVLASLGRQREAADDFAAAWRECSGDIDVLNVAAPVFRREGRYLEAIALLNGAPQQSPSDPSLLAAVAPILYSERRHQEAIALLSAGLKEHPGDPSLVAAIAPFLTDVGRHEESIALLNTAIEKSPNNPSLLAERSDAYRRAGDYVRAIADKEQVLKLDFDRGKQANHLAWMLVAGPSAVRNVKRGLEVAKIAMEINPANRGNINTMALALYRNGDFAAAIRLLEEHDQGRGPRTGFDHVVLAIAYERVGRAQDARARLRAARRSLAPLASDHPDDVPELRALLAEADGLIPDAKLPADPFARSPD